MDKNTHIEYDSDQKLEIQTGMNKKLDISFYAKPEFLAIQMRQIRLGLEEGLDVSVYSKPEYDWFQMEEIRKGLRAGIAYELYASPSIDYKRMRQIRKGLIQGIDLSTFVKLDAGILEELRKAIIAKVVIVDYIKDGYQVEQLTQIRLALEKHLDIRPFISLEHRGVSIREIRLGLEKGLPVQEYCGMDYNWQQMREIRLGMEARVDVKEYHNSLYSWQQMRELRLGLEEGIDISGYRSFMYTAAEMERIRLQTMLESAEQIVNGYASEITDEQVAIFISNDEMEACIEIRCTQDVDISANEIKARLRAHGICKGLLEEEIESLAREKKYAQTIVVAVGEPSKRGEDGRYEFYFNTAPSKQPKLLPDGSADFKEISWFEMVEQGQMIAKYFPAGKGSAGYTVTGKELKPHKGKEKNMLDGSGFQLLEDGRTYVSLMDGKIDLISEHTIEITRVCILEEVNYTTGNINFDGSVYIKGDVGSNAVICATENVVVNGFVEACTIRCGGEICLRMGVNGGGNGLVEAKKNIMGQFFEGVRVVSGGDISAHYALNCELRAEGSIRFYGAKGMLLGGYARAAKGIQAYNIGNKVGLHTMLNVGIDENSLKGLRQVELKIENINKELTILNNSWNEFRRKYSPEVCNTMELFLKIENAIYTKELELKKWSDYKAVLEEQLQEMKAAKIVVSGALFEGTKIVMNNVRWEAFGVRDVSLRCVNNKIMVDANS